MFTQVRLIIAALVTVAVLALGGYVYLTRKALHEAKARVVVAEQGTELAHETGAITERVVRSEVTIHTVSERQSDVVQSAPGADAQPDPAFLASLRGSIDIMRGGRPAPDDPHPANSP